MKNISLFILSLFFLQVNAQLTDFVTGLSNPVGLAKTGNTIYTGSVGTSIFHSIDISTNPPAVQNLITNLSFPTKFVVVGTDLYLTYGVSNVGKIDLNNPTPTITPILTNLNFAFGLAVKDSFLYISDREFNNGKILRFDYTATDPASTVETLVTGLSSFVNDIAFNGDELFFAHGGINKIRKINVTIPNPPVIDVVDAPSPLDVAFYNNYLYYSNSYLARIDITDPSATAEVWFDNVTAIWDILFDGDVMYLAQQLDGKISQTNINSFDPLSSDYAALQEFYLATNGLSWTNNTNWLNSSVPLSDWYGVSTSIVDGEERVTSVNLPSNQLIGIIPSNIGNFDFLNSLDLDANTLSGNIPSSIGNLTNLTELSLTSNNLSGNLPDSLNNLTNLSSVNLSGNSLSGSIPFNSPTINLNISDNLFDFSDIEPYFSSGNYNSITYSPQRTTDIPEDITDAPGSNITLSINDTDINRNTQASSLNNQYQWYQDNLPIPEATSANYEILNAQETDSGIYFCRITNPILPGLVIDRAPITLFIDSALNITDSQESKFTLYPNPVKNWLTITSNSLENATIEIYDLNGRLMLERKSTSNITSLNIENLKSGVYILTIKSNGINSQKRFIKQ